MLCVLNKQRSSLPQFSFASAGALLALWLTRFQWIKDRLFEFIACGAVAIHFLWLAAVPIVGEAITVYVGLLPINLMLTFLVSGLMFRWARWIAIGAGGLYSVALFLQHPEPLAPNFYMIIAGVYAGFAAYVAERARRDAATADADELPATRGAPARTPAV